MATVETKPIERISRGDDRFPSFCRWMVNQGMDMPDLLYMLEKPSHYQSEFNEFLSATEIRPESDS